MYTEYMLMLNYKNEEELLDKKVNQRYKINRQGAEERPQRHRRPRFWWHRNDENKPQK